MTHEQAAQIVHAGQVYGRMIRCETLALTGNGPEDYQHRKDSDSAWLTFVALVEAHVSDDVTAATT
jgi:hypothetical protein